MKDAVQVGDEKRAEALATPGRLVSWRSGNWSFLLSVEEVPGGHLWCFSAQLYPVGRGSTVEDWHHLGLGCASVGVPVGVQVVGNTVELLPNAVHKWIWVEEAAAP